MSLPVTRCFAANGGFCPCLNDLFCFAFNQSAELFLLSASLIFCVFDAYVSTQMFLLTKETMLEIKKVASMIRLSQSGTQEKTCGSDQTAYCILGGAATQFPRGCGGWVEFPERRESQGIHPDGIPGVGSQSNFSVPQPRFCFAILMLAVVYKLHVVNAAHTLPILSSEGIRVSWANSGLYWSPVE